MIILMISILTNSCTELSLLASGASIAGTQNAYVKAYNGVDVLTIMKTEKDIKGHVYDTIKTNRSIKNNN